MAKSNNQKAKILYLEKMLRETGEHRVISMPVSYTHLMNLKSLAIKNHSSDNEPKTAYIECEGKGVVTAADIQADQDVSLIHI